MNPHPDEEVIRLLQTIRPRESLHALRSALQAYGPTIRLVLRSLQTGSNVESLIEGAVSALQYEDLLGLVAGATSPRTETLIASICRTLPSNADSPTWLHQDTLEHVIANQTVMRLLLARWASTQREDMLQLLKQFSRFPDTASSAACLFEGWAHVELCAATWFALYEMTQQSDGVYKADQRGTSVALRVPKLKSANFRETGQATQTDVYYIPSASNNHAFDAFCRLNDDAIAFQMTLASTHSLKQAGLDFLKPAMHKSPNRRFVFVVPYGRMFTFKPPETIPIDKLTFWVLYIHIDYSVKPVIEKSYGHWNHHERNEEDA